MTNPHFFTDMRKAINESGGFHVRFYMQGGHEIDVAIYAPDFDKDLFIRGHRIDSPNGSAHPVTVWMEDIVAYEIVED